MLEAVIFDIDGTVLKTMERQRDWFAHWARVNGKQWPFNTFADFLSFYNDTYHERGKLQDVYNALDLPCDMNDRSHKVWHAYEQYMQSHPAALYPGIHLAVSQIWELGSLGANPDRSARLKLGINTTNSWKSIVQDLKRTGIVQFFDARVTEETLRAYQGTGHPEHLKKPSPVSLALILGLLNANGNYAMHIGDTRGDLKSSLKVIRLAPERPEKIMTVGVTWGYEPREILEQGVQTELGTARFDYLVDTPEQLVALIRQQFQ